MRAVLPIALGAALACGGSHTGRCPGRAIATLTFRGAAASATCGATFAPLEPFSATITVDAGGGPGAYLCTSRPLADPLVGTLDAADGLDVSSPAVAAGLGACDPSCAVALSERVAGTVLRGAGGEVTGFSGTLVDSAELASCAACDATCGPCDASCGTCRASCGTCTMPCAVTYPLVAP